MAHPKEDSQRLVLAREEHTTWQLLQHWPYARTVVSSMFTTPYVPAVATTVVRLQLRKKQPSKFNKGIHGVLIGKMLPINTP